MIDPAPALDDSLVIPKLKALRLWAVSDGRMGIKNQVLGLAEAIGRLLEPSCFEPHITTRDIHYKPLFDRWPTALKLWPDAMLARDSDPLDPPWPDVWIGAGRASLPHALRMKQRSHNKTLVVQLQDPKCDLKAFDIVIAPEHDQLSGPNVHAILGSTHRVHPLGLEAAFSPWRVRLEAFEGPYIAVLIGGNSKTHALSRERADTLSQQIRRAVKSLKGTLLLTLSRRTPPEAREIILKNLKDLKGIIYDGQGENPYFAFLHKADHILVTEDSVNMATEAAATGKPIHILGMDPAPGLFKSTAKFDHFHRALQLRKASRPFNGELPVWRYEPLNETDRAALVVIKALSERFSELAVSR